MDKNAIKKFATWARRELIERIRQQAYRYGVENANADPYATSAHGVVLTPTQRSQRQALIERMQSKGYEATIEEVTYTWFDRFCALRFMEVNGYLPGKMRMFSDANGAFRPQILSNALTVELDGLDIDTVIQLKEENKTEELFKYLLLTMCNVLKPILTLFQPDDRGCHLMDRDYTWLLLPDNLLREGSVPEQMVLTIPEDDWKDAVQIVGWLYQYYNAEPKDQVFANLKKNIKISKKDIPAATQLFTPDWIVRYMVQNSLGRLWAEGHPDNNLKVNWKYYLEEAEQEPEIQAQLAKIREGYASIKPEEILCIDPCMGSGHILVYMFDVLVQIYEAYGYPTREAVASIVHNNLWGLDIDDRAAQLANFAVMMVARRYDKGWFRRGIQPHVMAIQESNGIDRNHLRYLGNAMSDIEHNNAINQMEAMLDEFIDAKEYGSILQPQEYDWETLRRFVRMTAPERQITLDEAGIDATQERLMQMIEQAQALAQKYHVVVTNPPYLGGRKLDDRLLDYISSHFPSGKADLFSTFIVRCRSLTKPHCFRSMITQQAWMFLTSYDSLRVEESLYDTVNMIQLGTRAFDDIGGEVVQTTAFVKRSSALIDYYALYIKLTEYDGEKEKENHFFEHELRFVRSNKIFKKIKGAPIAYWASDRTYDLFETSKLLGDFVETKQGLKSSDDKRFFRYWPEVSFKAIDFDVTHISAAGSSKKKWFRLNKGGHLKWYGDYWHLINWENDGEEIKGYAKSLYHSVTRTITSIDYYFRESISWPKITSDPVFRIIPEGFIFSDAGSAMFYNNEIKYYLLAFLNTSIVAPLTKMLNPTVNLGVGDMLNIPFVIEAEKKEIVENLAKDNINLARSDWDSFETSWDFQQHPFIRFNQKWINEGGAMSFAYRAWQYDEGPKVDGDVEACFLLWQKECDSRFRQLKENEEELNRIFINIYGLQDELTPEVADKDVTVRKADLGRDIRSLVSYAVGCMLGRYSFDKAGLRFAGGNWQQWLAQQEKMTYAPDKDGILPITDDEYFDDDIVTMFIDWVRTAFDEGLLEENLKYISSALYPNGGGSARELIRQYFLNDFYKDHMKIYQKRPIYWMFDSGKKNGFKCLVYMHRWEKDTVARVRTDYVHEMQSRYRTAIEELSRRVDSANGSERVRLQKQLAKIQEQDAELLKYEEKIHHLADQMIAIDLDDGVKHNYAIFEDVLAPLK